MFSPIERSLFPCDAQTCCSVPKARAAKGAPFSIGRRRFALSFDHLEKARKRMSALPRDEVFPEATLNMDRLSQYRGGRFHHCFR